MVIPDMDTLSDDELRGKLEKLKDLEDYDVSCESCEKPRLLHVGYCVRT